MKFQNFILNYYHMKYEETTKCNEASKTWNMWKMTFRQSKVRLEISFLGQLEIKDLKSIVELYIGAS